MKTSFVLFLFLFFLDTICLAQIAEKRVALVIGNSNYKRSVILKSTKKDAQTLKDTLRYLNFDVIYQEDATLSQMRNSFTSFIRKASKADVRLIYFSGHGSQVESKNYLLPVDDSTVIDNPSLKNSSINIDDWINQLEAKKRLNIIILDACRTNSLPSKKGNNAGLTQFEKKPKGTFIAFATSPNHTAEDNGLYAKTLSQEMKRPVCLEKVFKNTREIIEQETGDIQIPEEWSRIKGDFFFNPPLPDTLSFLKTIKKTCLLSAITSLTGGVCSSIISGEKYKKYEAASNDFNNLYRKVENYDRITKIAFVSAGLFTAGYFTTRFILKSINARKEQTVGIYPLPLKNGGGVGLVYNF